MNMGLNVGPEQFSSWTLHFLLVMTTTGKALGVGNGEGEGPANEIEGSCRNSWRSSVLVSTV